MMDILLVAWWLIAGWCGIPPQSGAESARPGNSPLLTVLVGLVGAVIGGGVFLYLYPAAESPDIMRYTVSGLPALVLARLFSDIFAAVALGPQPEPPD